MTSYEETGGDWLDENAQRAINRAIVECNRANIAIYVVAGSPPPNAIRSYRGPVTPLTSPGEEIEMLASSTGGIPMPMKNPVHPA